MRRPVSHSIASNARLRRSVSPATIFPTSSRDRRVSGSFQWFAPLSSSLPPFEPLIHFETSRPVQVRNILTTVAYHRTDFDPFSRMMISLYSSRLKSMTGFSVIAPIFASDWRYARMVFGLAPSASLSFSQRRASRSLDAISNRPFIPGFIAPVAPLVFSASDTGFTGRYMEWGLLKLSLITFGDKRKLSTVSVLRGRAVPSDDGRLAALSTRPRRGSEPAGPPLLIARIKEAGRGVLGPACGLWRRGYWVGYCTGRLGSTTSTALQSPPKSFVIPVASWNRTRRRPFSKKMYAFLSWDMYSEMRFPFCVRARSVHRMRPARSSEWILR